jgi:hypothetical protein
MKQMGGIMRDLINKQNELKEKIWFKDFVRFYKLGYKYE